MPGMMQAIEEMSVAPPTQSKVIGYRNLSDAEVALMNEIKQMGNDMGRMVEGMLMNGSLDTRCVAVAKTHLQTGLMWLTRAVAQPTSF